MSTQLITIEQLQQSVPQHMKGAITNEVLQEIAKTLSDPEVYEHYRENLLSYGSVLKDGKYTVTQYLNAVKYCTYKMMGDTNINAYVKTFPDKYQNFINKNVSDKDISSYVHANSRTKLVTQIMAQSAMPNHIIYADYHHKAVTHLATLMVTAKSEKVQADAANALLTHLKPPEVKKVELEIGTKEDSALEALRKATHELVASQREAIKAGAATAQEVAHSRLAVVDVQAKEV